MCGGKAPAEDRTRSSLRLLLRRVDQPTLQDTAVKASSARRTFQGSLEPLEWCQMAPKSMEELSVRYMELSRTSLDIIHTYAYSVHIRAASEAIFWGRHLNSRADLFAPAQNIQDYYTDFGPGRQPWDVGLT